MISSPYETYESKSAAIPAEPTVQTWLDVIGESTDRLRKATAMLNERTAAVLRDVQPGLRDSVAVNGTAQQSPTELARRVEVKSDYLRNAVDELLDIVDRIRID